MANGRNGLCRALVVFALASSLLLAAACGGSAPLRRGVIERDVESWGFRRYQAVLDPEVWVDGNRSTGHTASYVSKQAEKRGRLAEADVVNAFVTRFASAEGLLPALVRFARRLAQEAGYAVEEARVSGTRLITVSGHGELWAWWVAGEHVIKIGGRGVTEVPEALIEAYADRYPSRLKAGVLEMELDEVEEKEIETEDYDPDNPKTQWQRRK